MDDLLATNIADLATQLAASAARNTATVVAGRVTALKASKSAADRAAVLEEIVSDLIEEKNELTRIAQAYEHELVAQQFTPGDVRYIADTIVPLLTKLAEGAGDPEEATKQKKQIETFAPLLSVETVNVLQLLGFNFRQGVGEPLTQRVKSLIEGESDLQSELALEQLRLQRAAMELAVSPDGLNRYKEMFPDA
ncbi:hypothetical protein DEJ33_06885 [Curtobacterium sp. MCPF17_047]|uniref:hypothetical protein n=1 Tax=Curtobacterium sp. MCPF17_047 TaxID=2175654 RepID=UPI000DA7BA39|nr:hypothetical protein [Curtobacterium sp. MCPF17_047]PZF66984.1 hypothetical protein DEJ33_06885 [Curtobacterium sp. MCPF17_047]